MNIVKFCTKPMNLWPRMLAQLPRHACLRSLVATSGCNRKSHPVLWFACPPTSQQDKGLSSFRTNAVDLRLKVWN